MFLVTSAHGFAMIFELSVSIAYVWEFASGYELMLTLVDGLLCDWNAIF